jgi:predicted O-methyltransferase YrrM
MTTEIRTSQDQFELERFVSFAAASGVERYLEIGARHGGSFDAMVRRLPNGGTYIAVDLPGGLWGKKDSKETLIEVVAGLRRDGYHRAQAVFGHSHGHAVINTVAVFAPFDLIFIDADHSYGAVRRDWEIYGPMGRAVAFHDINGDGVHDKHTGAAIGVPVLWRELGNRFQHVEIRNPGDKFGIGILWP